MDRPAAYGRAARLLRGLQKIRRPGHDPGRRIRPVGELPPALPNVSAELADAVRQNSDVVGWLTLPNTTINEAVVQTTNNDYYLRRDVKKNYAYEGCYYMDYESVMFDNGADLAQNTIIYGHNLGSPMGVKDDPRAPNSRSF